MNQRVDAWTIQWRLRPAVRIAALSVIVAATIAVSALGALWGGSAAPAFSLGQRAALLTILGVAGAVGIAGLRPAAYLAVDGRLLVRNALRTHLVHLETVLTARTSRRGLLLTLTDGSTVRVAALAGEGSVRQAVEFAPRLAWALGWKTRARLRAVPSAQVAPEVVAEIAWMQSAASNAAGPQALAS